tara:strand:- start:3894 stop:5396 length:1503 start_codon:yes stop_codon:yes gene_type:complete
MKAAILTETNNGFFYNNYRGLGAHIIKRIFHDHDATATVIDYSSFWDKEELTEFLRTYFKDSDDNVIGLSVPVRGPWDDGEGSIVGYLLEVSRLIKAELKNVRIIMGGIRVLNREQLEDYKDIDGVFIGRADEMLRDWIAKKDLSRFNRTEHKNIFTNLNYDMDKEKPVLFDLFQDDDCLNERDVLGLEVSLGCKFNCSFCNYPLRNAKNLKLNCEEAMLYTFRTAKEKHNITNFFIADDTLNESDEKLELLVKVVKQLDYKPNIACFARLDVLASRLHQIPMMKEAGIIACNFGIETLSKEAAKGIKKGYNFDKYVLALTELKRQIPGFWTSAGFIAGLKGDTFDNMTSKMNLLINKGLMDNMLMSELQIFPIQHKPGEAVIWDEGWLSSIDKDPENFGYNIDENGEWFTDYTTEQETKKFAEKFLNEQIHSKVFVGVDSFGFLSVLALGIGDQQSVNNEVKYHEGVSFRILNHKLKVGSYKHIRQYIRDKQEWIKSLN